jgi:ubiquitin-conjugating enzyme E2 I
LSIIGNDWKPSISIKEIVLGIQSLLDNPNEKSPANQEANKLYVKKVKNNDKEYSNKIKEQAKKHKKTESNED